MVEESEERLSEEQIEELIQTVADILPGDPEQENAAPADTEMDEAGEQSWQVENQTGTRRSACTCHVLQHLLNWTAQWQTGCHDLKMLNKDGIWKSWHGEEEQAVFDLHLHIQLDLNHICVHSVQHVYFWVVT